MNRFKRGAAVAAASVLVVVGLSVSAATSASAAQQTLGAASCPTTGQAALTYGSSNGVAHYQHQEIWYEYSTYAWKQYPYKGQNFQKFYQWALKYTNQGYARTTSQADRTSSSSASVAGFVACGAHNGKYGWS